MFFRLFTACAAMFLVAACQTPVPEMDEVEGTGTGIRALPFSLTVRTDATKVSYADGSTYQFKTGDKLQVKGVDRTDIEGVLEQQSGNVWSGILSYDAAQGGPTSDTQLAVTLIHADNADASTYASAIVGTAPEGSSLLREAVEHYSLFTADVTLSAQEAVLHQQATFLDVTVTFDFDGSHTVGAGQALVDLTTSLGKKTERTDLIPDSENPDDFYAHFMAVIPGGQTTGDFSLTVGDRAIEFTNNTSVLAANKKYTVTRSIEYRPQLGDPFWSDGTYGRLCPADPHATIVGIIVYVNRDNSAIANAITEKTAGFGHGLVMALKNVVVEGNPETEKWRVQWSGQAGKIQCTDAFVTTPDATISVDNLSGLNNTNKIITKLGANAVSAASRAKAYNVPVSSDYTSGWFLPSIGQWMYTISTDGFGGADPASQWLNGNLKNWLTQGGIGNLIYVKECEGTMNELIRDLNNRLSLLANDFSDKDLTYDSFGDPNAEQNVSDNYWTSSELKADEAIRMNLGTVDKKNNKYYSSIKVAGVQKTYQYYSFQSVNYSLKVRPFLAF